MKILLIGHEAKLNGASRSLLDIISVLEKKHEIFVLTAYNSGDFYDELSTHQVQILCYPFYRWCVQKFTIKNWCKRLVRWYFYEQFINRVTAKKVADYVRKQKIDVIHSNSSVINIGALIKKYSDAKHVWHIREFADLDFNMYPLVPKKYYYKNMNRFTDQFICVSRAICDHYPLLDEKKKRVVYNGVSERNILSSPKKIGREIRFLIAGRLSKTKGQEDAVKACLKLVEGGVTHFHLSIAGDGKLEKPIPEVLKEHVSLLGPVKNMPELRQNMDVELVCSKAEAFGRVTAEAMLGGMPVIGSNSGGTTELIIDGKNGYLYQNGDIDDLASKMKIFIEHPELCTSMGHSAQEYAKNHFTIEKCVQEIMKVYEE